MCDNLQFSVQEWIYRRVESSWLTHWAELKLFHIHNIAEKGREKGSIETARKTFFSPETKMPFSSLRLCVLPFLVLRVNRSSSRKGRNKNKHREKTREEKQEKNFFFRLIFSRRLWSSCRSSKGKQRICIRTSSLCFRKSELKNKSHSK